MDYYTLMINRFEDDRPLLPATAADAEIERLTIENRQLQSDLAAALNMVGILKSVIKEHKQIFRVYARRVR
jgi:hypothetical protein